MNLRRLELRTLRAAAVFDTEDAYARSERVFGLHPRPLGKVAYRIVARRVAGVAEPLREQLVLPVVRNPSGYDLWYGRHRRPDGARTADLPPGVYVLRVDGTFYQPTELDLTMPSTGAVPIDLQPGAAYPFPDAAPPGQRRLSLLRGTVVRDADGSPLPGAVVTVTGWPGSCVTDRTGQWVVPGPSVAQTADVTARLPDGTAQSRNGVLISATRRSTTVPQFRF